MPYCVHVTLIKLEVTVLWSSCLLTPTQNRVLCMPGTHSPTSAHHRAGRQPLAKGSVGEWCRRVRQICAQFTQAGAAPVEGIPDEDYEQLNTQLTAKPSVTTSSPGCQPAADAHPHVML